MSPLLKQVHRARFRITLNRWFAQLCVSQSVAAAAFAVVTLLTRLFDLPLPLGWIALGVVGAGLLASIIWAIATRVSPESAAATLDEAAGLRERISSALYIRPESTDPFERAVVSEAERVSSTVSVRERLRLALPRQFVGAATMTLVACAMLLLPAGILSPVEAKVEDPPEQFERTVNNIKKRVQNIKPAVKSNAELAKLTEEIDKLGTAPNAQLRNAKDARHEALKIFDRLQDALKDRQAEDRFKDADAFKKMLRGLAPMERQEAADSKLSEAMRKGDFKAAVNELKQLKDKLAKSATDPESKAQLKHIEKQLDALAKQLEKLAKDEDLQKKLAQAGIDQKQIEKLMKNMSKEDIENLKKKLQEQGLSQKAIENIAKQMQQNAGARKMAEQMSQSMQAAAQAMQQGQMDAAQQQLGEAAGQLSDMNATAQELSDMNSMMSQLQDARNDIGNPCSQCNGSGSQNGQSCGSCQGSGMNSMGGKGMGPKPGQGRGGIAPEESSGVQFVRKQGKVKMGPGAIAGQYLVDGPQEKGDVSDEVYDIVQAGERDATDKIDGAKVPVKYHRAMKEYFSEFQKELESMGGGGKGSTTDPDAESSGHESDPDDE